MEVDFLENSLMAEMVKSIHSYCDNNVMMMLMMMIMILRGRIVFAALLVNLAIIAITEQHVG